MMSASEDKPVFVGGREKYPELIAHAARGYTANDEQEGTHLLDYWRVIMTRRWTVLAILITLVAISAVWTLKQPPMYDATITIEIERETGSSVLNFKDFYQASDDYVDYTL